MKKLMIFFTFSSLLLSTGTPKAAGAFVTSTGNLNFRSGPSMQHTLRGLIPSGTFVFVKTCRENWCHIEYKSQTGWVSSRYLSFKNGNDLYRTYAIFPIASYNMYNFTTYNSDNEHHREVNERNSITNFNSYHTKNAKRNFSEK